MRRVARTLESTRRRMEYVPVVCREAASVARTGTSHRHRAGRLGSRVWVRADE